MRSWNSRPLIDALKRRHQLLLTTQDISALLAWLSRSSSKAGAQALTAELGEAGDQQAITRQAYQLLDGALFIQGQLNDQAAGVGVGRSDAERRRRFRLLLSAFHPDRNESMSNWLNERSQTLTRAYSDFKSSQSGTPTAEKTSSAQHRPKPRHEPAYEGISETWHMRLRGSLQERIRADHRLGHKIVGGLASLLLLAMISILLSESPNDFSIQNPESPATQADRLLTVTSPAPRATLESSAENETPPLDTWPRLQTLTQADRLRPDEADQSAGQPDPGEPEASNVIPLAAAATPSVKPDVISVPTPSQEPQVASLEPTNTLGSSVAQTAITTERPVGSDRIHANLPTPETERELNRRDDGHAPAAEAADRMVEIAPREPAGTLELGPLSRHPIAALLRDYQSAVESGNPVALVALFDENRRNGVNLDELVRIGAGDQRALSLSIVNSRTDGALWRLEVLHRLESLDDGRRLSHEPRLAVFRLSRKPSGLWIEDIHFDDRR